MIYWITNLIGFGAQLFFSARIIVQWLMSERAKRVLSPTVFWIFSLLGSYLLSIYGWLRDDFAIIFGQFVTYYVYIWNLKAKHEWQKWPKLLRSVILFTPLIVILFLLRQSDYVLEKLFYNEEIPLGLLVFGALGQLLFTLRFIYQYLYSKRRNSSILPSGFWIISIIGSMCILIYGIFRSDLVLIIGQSFGLFAYIRNLIILRNQSRYAELEVSK